MWRATVALALLLVPVAAQAETRSVFYLQPLGPALPDADVEAVKTALTEMYGIPVRALNRVELPRAAWYAPRKRYRAEKLLDYLRPLLPDDGVRILGLTAVDISTTKGSYADWGVMGLGEVPGTVGVISSFRCYKKTLSPTNGRERLAKTATHEIGHTLGLPHCPDRACLMADAEGQVKSADREVDLCATCRAKLATEGHVLPNHPHPPWPPLQVD